jgi:hypothetical protein
MVAGVPRSGRSQLLRTLAGAVAACLSCADAHLYALIVLNMTLDEIPVVGEVTLAATGVHLAGDYLYDHWTPFRDVANEVGHAPSRSPMASCTGPSRRGIRAALVIDVDPAAVTASRIRPARFYDNYLHGYFSRRTEPRLSPVWVVPTRHPEALRKVLANATAHA